MKAAITLFSFIFSVCLSFSQDVASLKAVTITFCNNSSLSKKISFISYAPDEAGNATIQTTLKPFAVLKQTYKVGTRIYVADEKQVNVVMSGQKLEGKPFKIAMKNDDKKIINLNNQILCSKIILKQPSETCCAVRVIRLSISPV